MKVDDIRLHPVDRAPEVEQRSCHRPRTTAVDSPSVLGGTGERRHRVRSEQVYVVTGLILLLDEVLEKARHTTPADFAHVQNAQP